MQLEKQIGRLKAEVERLKGELEKEKMSHQDEHEKWRLRVESLLDEHNVQQQYIKLLIDKYA